MMDLCPYKIGYMCAHTPELILVYYRANGMQGIQLLHKVAVVLGHTSVKTTETSYARPRDDRVVAEILNLWSEKNGII